MVLAYLVEYEHNFGQAITSASPHDDAIGIGFEATKQELLLMKGLEAPVLVKLLTNT